jgi:hypothetical protein
VLRPTSSHPSPLITRPPSENTRTHADRRALPHRPSLLVGDLAACEAELNRLQAAAAALRASSAAASPAAWAPLAHRHRWLRESLVSQRAGSTPLAVAVYGAAADAALRAQDWGEFLKSASHLVDVEQEEEENGGRGEGGGSGRAPALQPPPPRPSAWGSDDDEEEGASSAAAPRPDDQDDGAWRRGEALAALVLYFAAAAPTPQCLDAARLLRKAAAARRRRKGSSAGIEWPDADPAPDLAFALAVHAAVRAGDGLRVCALAASPPHPSATGWRAAALCAPALDRARRAGLAALASAHRSLPASVVLARLALGEDEGYAALAALVRAKAGGEGGDEGGGGCGKGSSQAWAVRALPGVRPDGELVFKG